MPSVVVTITRDRGDVWQVEAASAWAREALKHRPGGTDPCLAKDDPNWEPDPPAAGGIQGESWE